MAVENSSGVESRYFARVILTERGHRKRLRDGSIVVGFVFHSIGEGQPTEPGGDVSDDVDPRNPTRDRRMHLAAPIPELRRRGTVIFRGDQPPGFHVGPERRTIVLELREHLALHRFCSCEQTERVRF